MSKNIFAAFISAQKTVAFCIVEPANGALELGYVDLLVQGQAGS